MTDAQREMIDKYEKQIYERLAVREPKLATSVAVRNLLFELYRCDRPGIDTPEGAYWKEVITHFRKAI